MRSLPISWAASRFDRDMRFKSTTWESLKRVLSTPKAGKESYNEYLSYDKETQLNLKDVGFYIVGKFDGDVRHNATFQRRATITLDIDVPGADWERRLGVAFAGL